LGFFVGGDQFSSPLSYRWEQFAQIVVCQEEKQQEDRCADCYHESKTVEGLLVLVFFQPRNEKSCQNEHHRQGASEWSLRHQGQDCDLRKDQKPYPGPQANKKLLHVSPFLAHPEKGSCEVIKSILEAMISAEQDGENHPHYYH
jgi:hypothetical protein